MIATCNFITNHNDGGRQCSYRNYDFLCQTFGKDNVMLYMITNDLIENNQNITCYPTYRNKIQQIVWALKCRNGYSRKTEEKIISEIGRASLFVVSAKIVTERSHFRNDLIKRFSAEVTNFHHILF